LSFSQAEHAEIQIIFQEKMSKMRNLGILDRHGITLGIGNWQKVASDRESFR
jgi:hypothetical protein